MGWTFPLSSTPELKGSTLGSQLQLSLLCCSLMEGTAEELAALWATTDGQDCSIFRTLEVLHDRWTVLVLREVFNGLSRFDDIQAHLRISRSVLTDRLAALVAAGVLERRPYQVEGARAPPRVRAHEHGPRPAPRDDRDERLRRPLAAGGRPAHPSASATSAAAPTSACGSSATPTTRSPAAAS